MTAGAGPRQLRAPLLLAAAMLVGAGASTAVAGRPALHRDRDFAVVEPRDGAKVDAGFRLAWAGGNRHAAAYAVVVDAALPAPGAVVQPGARTMVLTVNAMTLTLGPSTGGSPSARAFHVLQVVPLGPDGRRLGEDVAVVHVRSRA